ncbi:MAG: hypothetical protein QW532_00270 [Archaeoglobaceae archaeon]
MEELKILLVALMVSVLFGTIFVRKALKRKLDIAQIQKIKEDLEFFKAFKIISEELVKDLETAIKKIESAINFKEIGKKALGLSILVSLLVFLYLITGGPFDDTYVFIVITSGILAYLLSQIGALAIISSRSRDLSELVSKVQKDFRNYLDGIFSSKPVNSVIIAGGDFAKAFTKTIPKLGEDTILVLMPPDTMFSHGSSTGNPKNSSFLSCLGDAQSKVLNFIFENEEKELGLSGKISDKFSGERKTRVFVRKIGEETSKILAFVWR